MLVKKGISFSPENVNMQIVDVGTSQKCSDCGVELDVNKAENGLIKCVCGKKNPINLEQ